jgi:hypothetical protein
MKKSFKVLNFKKMRNRAQEGYDGMVGMTG